MLMRHVCPQGRLCECRHDNSDPEFACPHCGCDCSLPDVYARSGDPDDCPCCGRYIP